MQIWVADGERGLMRGQHGIYRRVGAPGRALCAAAGKIYCAGEKRCVCYDRETAEPLFDFAVPPEVCALAAMGDGVYALSADADSVTAFSADTGEARFCAPAGNYPRALRASPRGNCLAVAGGAAGEILLLDGCLRPVGRHRVPGTAVDVCFLPRGMAALCAVGDGELSARLMRISPRGVAEEWFAASWVPCALCPLESGRCLVGGHGGVTAVRGDGRAAFRLPCPYPAKLDAGRGAPLIVDPWQGAVFCLTGERIYQGGEPLDVLAVPAGAGGGRAMGPAAVTASPSPGPRRPAAPGSPCGRRRWAPD